MKKHVNDDTPHLSIFTVESIELRTNRLIYSDITACSIEDAFRWEKAHFGFPHFRVIRAYPKQE